MISLKKNTKHILFEFNKDKTVSPDLPQICHQKGDLGYIPSEVFLWSAGQVRNIKRLHHQYLPAFYNLWSCRHFIGHFFCMCFHVLPVITSSPFKVCYCCYINNIIKWRKQIDGLCGESNLISKWSLISFFLGHAMRHEGYLSSLTRDQYHARCRGNLES